MNKKRILLGEDDPSILKTTKFRLQHEGFEVITAMDGEAVLAQATDGVPIHLILLDVKLPKKSGYDVCYILKHQSDTSKIPVIIFSASERELQQLANRCIEVGAADWLKKPFRSVDLMAKIHRILEEEAP